MIKWKTLTLGQMATNCYLVWDEETKEALIIDPADEGIYLSEELSQLQLIPKYIGATHGHFDHLMGALDLKLIYQIPFLLGKSDEFLLKRAPKSAQFWLKKKISQPQLKLDIDLETIDHLMLGKSRIEILWTPGHTPGGVCFYSRDEGILMAGDTAGEETMGRTDLSYSNKGDLEKSRRLLKKLPNTTIVLPGHGRQFSLSMI